MTSIEGNGGVNRAGARTQDGRIWFPNRRSLVSVRTGDGDINHDRALRIRFRTLDHANEQPIHLPRLARHLEFELTAIALAEPENVQFRYRFDSDPDWTEAGHRRNLNFRDLKPGRHSLEFSSRYVGSPWSGEPVRLDFSAGYRLHEHPVFYEFLLSLTLIVVAGVWLAGNRH